MIGQGLAADAAAGPAAERGAAERGAAERGAAERGAAERGAAERGAAVRPPVLRTQEDDGERRATWTELFFDLVFVAAVGRTSQILADDPSGAGAAWFAFVFVAITWAWSNFVLYTERFDTDDVPHRLMKAVAMVTVAGIAYTATDIRGEHAVEFALAYAAMRVVLIALYARAWRHVVEVRSATAVYLVGFSIAAACWVVSTLVDGDGRTALWVAALAIEIMTPILGWRRFGEASAAAEHLEERAGQFTLIVLGEAVIRSVDGLDGVRWSGALWLTVLPVAVVIAAVWWLTFDFVAKVPTGFRALGALGGHIPAFTALAALGVGFELAFHHAEDPALLREGRWILCGAAALYLAGVTCTSVAAGRSARALAVHPVTLALVIGAGALATSFPAPAVVAVVAVALVAEVVYKGKLYGWTGDAADDDASAVPA